MGFWQNYDRPAGRPTIHFWTSR